jgi:uridine nucleosidase
VEALDWVIDRQLQSITFFAIVSVIVMLLYDESALIVMKICTAHAAQIVLNVPTKKTMIPINVTHTAIFTREKHTQLLRPGSTPSEDLPRALTNLRHTLSTLINFFADSYRTTFGFKDGPPLHDALTVVYVARPELFATTRHRVDIELTGTHSMGETVVDMWKYKPVDDTWGTTGRNCLVADSLKVSGLRLLMP